MLNELIQKLDSTITNLQTELGGLRTGRASTGLVDSLMVDVYGSQMSLQQIASVSVPESRTIMIQPWDKANLGPIEKAIRDSDLGLNPMNDGIVIRIGLPPLTAERREELVKVAGQKAEAARISIRNLRHDVFETTAKQLKAKEIGEDDKDRMEKSIQEQVTKYNSSVEDILRQKEEEIRTV